MKRDPRETAVYQDCLKLFIERDGENVAEIEREMRGRLGYTNFHRRILYGRSAKGVCKPGWIERFGWKRNADTPVRNASGARTSSQPASSSPPRRREAEPPASAGGSLKNSLRLREWLDRVSPGMKWGWPHLRIVQEYLELVTKGEVKRLMIFMPPRHGKSELVTVRYAAKRLADDPSMNVIIGSYNQRLANRFSRKVRRVLADAGIAERSADTPVRMDASASTTSSAETQSRRGCASCAEARASARAVAEPHLDVPPLLTRGPGQQPFRPANSLEEWETAHGGGVRAVGVGAGVTGYGASLIIIDDPVKNRAEAESKTYRDKVYDWFNDDISTRLEPDGAIILIQTRWHEDDLAGRLLKEMASGGEEWDILALPAIAEDGARTLLSASATSSPNIPADNEHGTDAASGVADKSVRSPYFDPLGRSPGEALCPERFPIEDLEKMRRRLGSYSFSALYQQRPTPLEGGLFKRKWLTNVIEKLPVGVKLVRAYDLAVSTRTTADYTASVLGGFDNRGNFYIADIMRRRLEFPEQKRFILDRMMREPHIQHGVELALHGQAIIQDLRRYAPTRAVALKGIRVETDKITRALAWAALAEERKLFLVRGPYLRDFIEEAASFPNSKHDDQIDAVSLAISMSSQHKHFRHAGF